tara:strand:+ start:146 stop:553 length:408 start_codon:yes stop_codon:yes gene_type:complete
MAGRASIELRGASFDWRARADLGRIRSDSAAEVDQYAESCAAGHSQCLAVMVHGARRGTLIASWLNEGETVFVCNAVAVDRIPGRDMTRELFEMMQAWALDRGAAKMRFWTARRGLAVRTEEWGFSPLYVMEKGL